MSQPGSPHSSVVDLEFESDNNNDNDNEMPSTPNAIMPSGLLMGPNAIPVFPSLEEDKISPQLLLDYINYVHTYNSD
jgi:hypothetical protein